MRDYNPILVSFGLYLCMPLIIVLGALILEGCDKKNGPCDQCDRCIRCEMVEVPE